MPPFYCGAILWTHIPFAIMHSIWKERNDGIFRGLRLDFDDTCSVVIYRLAKWAILKKEVCIRIDDILYDWKACFLWLFLGEGCGVMDPPSSELVEVQC